MGRIFALAAGAIFGAQLSVASEAAGPAQKFVEAQYGPKKMAPLIEQHVEARVGKPQDIDRVIKAVQKQLPEFYAASAAAVSPLISVDQMNKVADFAVSQTGRRLAQADLRWAEEVRDQAEVCLEDGLSRIQSIANDRPRAVNLAARLVLGDCTVMREAKKELRGTITQDNLDRARVYVDAGGVRGETIKGLAAAAAQSAARTLIAAKVGPASESKALAAAVLAQVAAETTYWKDAAALHYAAAFRQDDLKRLAAFVTSDAGAEFLNAKPKIDATIARTADKWFAGSIAAALAGDGGLASSAAASAGVAAMGGPLIQPQLAVKPVTVAKPQPILVVKPGN